MNDILRWSTTTWYFDASTFLSGITSTYTAMFSADLIPWTLTFPLISFAATAVTRTSANPPATAIFDNIPLAVIALLSSPEFHFFADSNHAPRKRNQCQW